MQDLKKRFKYYSEIPNCSNGQCTGTLLRIQFISQHLINI